MYAYRFPILKGYNVLYVYSDITVQIFPLGLKKNIAFLYVHYRRQDGGYVIGGVCLSVSLSVNSLRATVLNGGPAYLAIWFIYI